MEHIYITKASKDDLARISSGTPLFASSTSAMTDTTKNYVNTTDGYLYIYSGGNWSKTNVKYQGTGVEDESITDIKINPNSNIVLRKIGRNLLDMAKITEGYYINYANGKAVANANYCISEFIDILPKEMTLSNFNTTTISIEQLAFYTENETYISGLSNSGVTGSVTFTPPQNARKIRLTINNKTKGYIMLEYGNTKTTYEDYYSVIEVSMLEKGKLDSSYLDENLRNSLNTLTKKRIVVKSDGTGDYANLRLALEGITDSNIYNQYEVLIHEGEYDIMSYYSESEINTTSFIGLIKPPFVDLIGVGNAEKVVLKGELTPSYPSTTRTRVSTLVTYGTGKLKNLVVTAKHLRYAVHDDYNYTDLERVVDKCKFIKYNSSGYEQAYGSGVFSGHKHKFIDCEFHSETGNAYSVHNNKNFTTPANIELIGCKFTTDLGQSALRFGSMGSGTKDIVKLIGCESNKKALFFEEQSNGVGCDFEVKGYGNDIFDISVTGTTSKTITNNNGFIKTV